MVRRVVLDSFVSVKKVRPVNGCHFVAKAIVAYTDGAREALREHLAPTYREAEALAQRELDQFLKALVRP